MSRVAVGFRVGVGVQGGGELRVAGSFRVLAVAPHQLLTRVACAACGHADTDTLENSRMPRTSVPFVQCSVCSSVYSHNVCGHASVTTCKTATALHCTADNM